jgi:hypothetical protein
MADKVKKIFNCDYCKYSTIKPSDWLKHIESMKHARNGEKKPLECSICDYIGLTHWNLRMHKLAIHSTKEERQKSKYYCNDCDQVFFCPLYFNKHNSSKKHQNMVFAITTHNELYS